MTKKRKYINTSDQTQMIVGMGSFEPQAIVETTEEIINPSFELVGVESLEEDTNKVGIVPVTKPKRK